MITVYKKKPSPNDRELVTLNDIFFNKSTATRLDDRAKDIIAKIDQSEMLSPYAIASRFDGMKLNIDKLSTGCKTALNILYNPDKVFDIRECGDNALDVIYALPSGNVYCDYPLISFEMDKVMVRDDKGVREVESYEALKEWWAQ
ncbi:MAG: DUF4869 domain-containing protein [Clostridia bacterium]|nr:DUF4869 domain-containing protein [Clostridia bacterium]MBR6890470.1 DUF4869 domain-containing protein [Clostridia bacterium]